MSNSFHIGDSVTQYGDHNIGIAKSQAPAEVGAYLETLLEAVRLLRGHVPAEDQQVLDDALETIEAEPSSPNGAVRRALASIAGVASMVGAVGVPVIEAVQGVRAALGS